jgi:hypothetical protein
MADITQKAAEKPKRKRAPKAAGTEELQKNLALFQDRPLVTKMGSGADVFPDFGFYRKTKKKPCAWGEKNKPFPTGRVELDIVTNRDAAALGVKPGPALRLCLEGNEEAPIVNVDTPEEALKIGANFRDCVVGGKANKDKQEKKACALKTLKDTRGLSPKQVKFAGAPKRSRSKRSSK